MTVTIRLDHFQLNHDSQLLRHVIVWAKVDSGVPNKMFSVPKLGIQNMNSY